MANQSSELEVGPTSDFFHVNKEKNVYYELSIKLSHVILYKEMEMSDVT